MNELDWLREHMRDHISNSGLIELTERLSRFPSAPGSAAARDGEAALGLVFQAAEVVKGIEERANKTETIAKRAVEHLRLAEKRIQELEAEQQVTQARIKEAHAKIQDAEEALKLERSRVDAAENQLYQLETRATAAEARAKEGESALARIEDAIRTQLLGQGRSAFKNSTAFEGKQAAARHAA